MTYKIEIGPDARAQIRALPPGLPQQFAEVMAMLELAPWNSEPINKNNPDGAVRQLVFGKPSEVMVTFLALDRQRRVDVLELTWLD